MTPSGHLVGFFLILTELRCTVNHTSECYSVCFSCIPGLVRGPRFHFLLPLSPCRMYVECGTLLATFWWDLLPQSAGCDGQFIKQVGPSRDTPDVHYGDVWFECALSDISRDSSVSIVTWLPEWHLRHCAYISGKSERYGAHPTSYQRVPRFLFLGARRPARDAFDS